MLLIPASTPGSLQCFVFRFTSFSAVFGAPLKVLLLQTHAPRRTLFRRMVRLGRGMMVGTRMSLGLVAIMQSVGSSSRLCFARPRMPPVPRHHSVGGRIELRHLDRLVNQTSGKGPPGPHTGGAPGKAYNASAEMTPLSQNPPTPSLERSKESTLSPPVRALARQRPGEPIRGKEGERGRREMHVPSDSKAATSRSAIKIGMRVSVVKKEDQRTGKLTEGEVMRLLTNSAVHPRGIKVSHFSLPLSVWYTTQKDIYINMVYIYTTERERERERDARTPRTCTRAHTRRKRGSESE